MFSRFARLILSTLLFTAFGFAANTPIIFWIDNNYGVASYANAEGGNGMYLSIGGNYFGNTNLGTSAVKINGTSVAQVLTWTNRKIGVQIASGTTTGAVTVTVGGNTATGPTFTVRSGSGAGYRIFYVDGHVDNTAPGSCASMISANSYVSGTPGGTTGPWGFQNTTFPPSTPTSSQRTPYSYYKCMSPGDTLVLLQGAFYPWFDNRGLYGSMVLGDFPGTSGSPITITARPGANAGIGGYPGSPAESKGFAQSGSGANYTTISGLHIIASGLVNISDAVSVGGTGMRIVNNDIQCPTIAQAAGCVGGMGPSAELLGNVVHNVSQSVVGKTTHPIYFDCCTTGPIFEVAWNQVFDTHAYNCIQFNDNGGLVLGNLTIHDNYFADCYGSGINWSTVGFDHGTFVNAYNNVVWHTGVNVAAGGSGGDPHSCLAYKGYSATTTVGTVQNYNNTCYDNSGYFNFADQTGTSSMFDIYANTTSVTREYVNNIFAQPCYVNTGSSNVDVWVNLTYATQAQVNAVTTGSTNNLYYSACTPTLNFFPQTPGGGTILAYTTAANPISVPSLQPGSSSPAVAAGTATLYPATDIDGNPRPNPPAIGAFEYNASPSPNLPWVITTIVSGVSGGGTVENNGGAAITSEGTCWATRPFPQQGESGVTCSSDGTATPFTSTLSGMPAGTLIYYNAYACNSAGCAYGGLNNLTTPVGFTIISTLVPGVIGLAESQQFVAANGVTPYTWSETGALPTGMSFSSSGLLSGTPSVSGTFSVTFTATDSTTPTNQTTSSTQNIVIAPALVISTTTLPGQTQGVAYNQTVSASGGNAPYAACFVLGGTGALPNGLSAAPSSGGCAITGTPTAPGIFTFTLQISDSTAATNSGPATTQSVPLSITINPPAPSISIDQTSPLTSGVTGTAYSLQFTATGGTGIGQVWSNPTGAMPPGISLSGSGLFSGTPTTPGTYTPTIQVTDSGTNTTSTAFTIAISSEMTISPATGALTNAVYGIAYSQTFTVAGGASPYTWAISGTTPPGFSFNTSSGVLSGTPTKQGTSSFTIMVTDSNGINQSSNYTLTVITGTSGAHIVIKTVVR